MPLTSLAVELMADGLFMIETSDGDAWLGQIVFQDGVVVHDGFVGRPPVVAQEDVLAITPGAEHPHVVLPAQRRSRLTAGSAGALWLPGTTTSRSRCHGSRWPSQSTTRSFGCVRRHPCGRILAVALSERGERAEAQLATTAALRKRLAESALEVARVEDKLADTLDCIATRDVGRADELHARATASRRYAEAERQAARRFISE